MKKGKYLIAVLILIVSLVGTILAPVPVSAAVIDVPIVEPNYAVFLCECGGTASFNGYEKIGDIEYVRYYCPSCKCYFYREKYQRGIPDTV